MTVDDPTGARASFEREVSGRFGVMPNFFSSASAAPGLIELVANAVQHGAFKHPNGHLTVRWRLETKGESGKPWLHIDWKESGVEMPPLGAAPLGSEQGRELIEQTLPYQFDAKTTSAIEADGVHCTISLPVSRLQGKLD